MKSFRPLGGSFFRDDAAVYCVWYSWDDLTCDIVDVDLETFEVIDGGFARDARGLIKHSHRVDDVDASSFEILHSLFARDACSVYFLRHGDKHTEHISLHAVNGADAQSFEVFHPRYARDKDAVYFFDDCGSLAAERHLLKECFRVETERPEHFVPLRDQHADPIVPDGYDGERLFLRGRHLDLAPESYRVRTGEDFYLEYVDIDRVSTLVASAYNRFFPTETAPSSVDPLSLGPVAPNGGYEAVAPLQSAELPAATVQVLDDNEDDIPF